MSKIDAAPLELADAIREFWPAEQWDNAAAVAQLESAWNAFAFVDTSAWPVDANGFIYYIGTVGVSRERSVSYFQIDTLSLPPGWRWFDLFNVRHNVATAHLYWTERGWRPWFFSATALGLI